MLLATARSAKPAVPMREPIIISIRSDIRPEMAPAKGARSATAIMTTGAPSELTWRPTPILASIAVISTPNEPHMLAIVRLKEMKPSNAIRKLRRWLTSARCAEFIGKPAQAPLLQFSGATLIFNPSSESVTLI